MKQRTTRVPIDGEWSRDYATGDYLNAIDDISCAFEHHREITGEEMAAALRLYAAKLDEGGEE